MILVIILDFLVVVTLLVVAMQKGFTATLPVAAFFLVLFPEESKISIGGLFDITTQRLVVLMLFFLVLLMTKQRGASPEKLPLKGWIVLLTVWWTLSAINSIAFTDSAKSLFSLLLDYIAVYVIYAKYVPDVETVKKVLFGLASGVIVCSVFGVMEAYGHWSVISLFPVEIHRFGASGDLYQDTARGLRVQSTFGHPILFGTALALAIPMTLYLLSLAKKGRRKTFLWIGILLMFTCIFKASSRGPWMALAASLALLLFFGRGKIKKYMVIISMLTLTVLVVRPGVWETIWNDYAATVDPTSYQGQSYQYRYELYSLVSERLDQSFDRMLLGFGPQSFPMLHLTGKIEGRTMSFASCDSAFAELWAETGYVGLLIVCLMLALVIFRTVRCARRLPSPDNRLCLLFFVNLAAFCFEMTNAEIFGWGQQAIMLWIVIALTSTYPYLVKATLPSEEEIAAVDILVNEYHTVSS
ncbi:hypothetical protein GCM10011507_09330 [Edaphobacter acidisoli]|uniref:O-antigen ligase-related domain-containing protein n=1 Tax=Edaphobacter acidisoli TaxID=2040573 RepID=A0A916RKB4_9BACT|nr:O-antigen ligase family protein [Edaphobacter acidisoli]GGA59913.1 hypothetical protein GCM10011507_09330 [Edaphobacter acidisoli]